ncbi:MAG: selenium metabolism-associated LysR family transcriptional regulator [Syntrophobacteria bacterium]
MDLRRLEVFCKVFELKSFSRAAEASLLSQPTVSEHIRHLENCLDVQLFDRLGREVVPTPAGKILYSYARRMLNLRREATRTLERYRGKVHGELELGGSTIPGQYILPSLIGTFKQNFAGIRIKLVIADTMRITSLVLDGSLELGVVGARMKNDKLKFHRLFEDELVLAVPADHPWCERSHITLEELSEAPFIMREQGSGTKMVMHEILEKAGLEPERLNVMAEMGSTDAVRQAIKAKVGVSILSRRAVADDLHFRQLCQVPIEGVHFTRSFYLVIHKSRSRSPLGQAFTDFLLQGHGHDAG